MSPYHIEGDTPAERSAFERRSQGLPAVTEDRTALLVVRAILEATAASKAAS
jgi:hypothetical protein